jgi:hypothetical protein
MEMHASEECPQESTAAMRFVALSLCLSAGCVAAILLVLECFHRYVILRQLEPSRIHFQTFLEKRDKIDYIAFGSSQMNMSLNIDNPRFYNLAWRGETISEAYVKLNIVLREKSRPPCRIFLEANPPIMLHSGTANPLYYYAHHVAQKDLRIFERHNIKHTPDSVLAHLSSNYKRDIWLLLDRYLREGMLSPDMSRMEVLPNGYSYNKVSAPQSFLDAAAGRSKLGELAGGIHPNFDLFYRRFIELAKDNRIAVTLVATPFHRVLREATTPVASQVAEYIKRISSIYEVDYVDFSSFTDDLIDFWNEDHMSLIGATRFGRYAESVLLKGGKTCEGAR